MAPINSESNGIRKESLTHFIIFLNGFPEIINRYHKKRVTIQIFGIIVGIFGTITWDNFGTIFGNNFVIIAKF